jgi:hypothetical protein
VQGGLRDPTPILGSPGRVLRRCRVGHGSSLGFAMRCQLARRPGLLCSFCPSPRTFAPRLPPDKSSRPCPCLRLVVIIDP